jgi:hypothetical protein
MAEKTITVRVEFAPGTMDALRKLIREGLEQSRSLAATKPEPPGLEVVTVRTPTGDRAMYVDAVGLTHWVPVNPDTPAPPKSWKLVYVLKGDR